MKPVRANDAAASLADVNVGAFVLVPRYLDILPWLVADDSASVCSQSINQSINIHLPRVTSGLQLSG